MLDEEHRQRELAPKEPDQPRQDLGLARVHPRRGLVEQQEARLRRQRTRDLEASLVPVRQVAGHVVGLVAEADEAEKVVGPPPSARFLGDDGGRAEDRPRDRPGEPAVPAHEHVVEGGELLEEPDRLEGARDAARHDGVGPEPDEAPPLEGDAPGVRLDEAGHHVEEGRLARAVRPDQSDDRGGRDQEVDLVDGDEAAEALAHTPHLQQR